MAKGAGSGISRLQEGEEEVVVICKWGSKVGVTECACDEFGEGGCEVHRLSVDRYCTRE